MMTKTQTILTVLLLLLLSAGGCSSWGGKINNTEGVNYYARGEYDQALTAFQTASRLNPDDPEIYYNIASTYQQQALRYQDPSLLTQAETNYRICLQKNPTRETTVCCYRGLATVLNQRKDEKQAMKVLQEWEEKEPNSVEPKLEIAYLLEAQGKNQESADALTKIKDWAPNDYRAFYKLGLVEEKLGNSEAALENLRAASRLNPTNQDITNKITQLESKGSAPMVAPPADTAQNGAPPLSGAASPTFVTRTEQPAPTFSAAQTSSVQNDPAAAPPAQDGFSPVTTAPAEPALNAPPADAAAQAPALDGAAPSYDAPAPGSLPATPPETKPASPPPLDSDPLFDSELTKAAPKTPVWTAASPVKPQTAEPAATQTAAAAPAQTVAPAAGTTLPDGTGSSTFKLAYAEAAAAPAAVPAAPAEKSAVKSKIGDPNPGPPRTSVGVPF